MVFTVAFVPGVTLTKWTRAWDERRSDVALQVMPITELEQLAVLHARTADVGFVRLPIDADGLSIIRLYSEVPVVVMRKDHDLADADTLTMADLAGENLLAPAADALGDTIELVAAGVGVLLLPQSVARLHSRKDIVARPVADEDESEIALAWLASETTADIDEFVGIVRGRTARSSRRAPTPAVAGDATAPTAAKGQASKTGKGGASSGAVHRTQRQRSAAAAKGRKRR